MVKERSFIGRLKLLDACPEAVEWAAQYPTLQAAWDACERGDWMLWLLGKSCGSFGSKSHRRFVRVTCLVVRQVSDKWVDPRSENAVATAERYAVGEHITQDELHATANEAAWAARAALAAEAAWAAGAASLLESAKIIRKLVPKIRPAQYRV